MKILHLWRGDAPSAGGGGAGAMYRVHSNLRKKGIDSSILCEEKTTLDSNVHVIPGISRSERVLRKITSSIGMNDVHRISSFSLKNNIHVKGTDVLHFHGTHSGFLNYLALPAITRGKPAIFTLRDMWALTGHCAYCYECDRWKYGCGNCPYPENHPKVSYDNTKLEWKCKKNAFDKSNIEIVAVSKWIYEQAKISLLKNKKITYIPESVDTNRMFPLDKDILKKALNISRNKKVLLFSATGLNSRNKGGDILLNALKALPQSLKKETVLLLTGSRGGQLMNSVDFDFIDLGFVSNDRLRAIAFSAADLFVFPSRAESFGLVVLESMACGTPVVAQKIGPLPELVRPGISGILSDPENSKDFANGIIQLLEDHELRKRMAINCREIAVTEYPVDHEIDRHIELYNSVLSSQT